MINLQENGGTEVEESHICMPTRIAYLLHSVYLQRTSYPHKVVIFSVAIYIETLVDALLLTHVCVQ